MIGCLNVMHKRFRSSSSEQGYLDSGAYEAIKKQVEVWAKHKCAIRPSYSHSQSWNGNGDGPEDEATTRLVYIAMNIIIRSQRHLQFYVNLRLMYGVLPIGA